MSRSSRKLAAIVFPDVVGFTELSAADELGAIKLLEHQRKSFQPIVAQFGGKWLKELGNPYSDVIIDDKGLIGIDWGVYGIPETFVVNSKGIIKYRLAGPITKEKYNNFYSKISESEN